jgi:hypothetical protein
VIAYFSCTLSRNHATSQKPIEILYGVLVALPFLLPRHNLLQAMDGTDHLPGKDYPDLDQVSLLYFTPIKPDIFRSQLTSARIGNAK